MQRVASPVPQGASAALPAASEHRPAQQVWQAPLPASQAHAPFLHVPALWAPEVTVLQQGLQPPYQGALPLSPEALHPAPEAHPLCPGVLHRPAAEVPLPFPEAAALPPGAVRPFPEAVLLPTGVPVLPAGDRPHRPAGVPPPEVLPRQEAIPEVTALRLPLPAAAHPAATPAEAVHPAVIQVAAVHLPEVTPVAAVPLPAAGPVHLHTGSL